MTLQFSAEERGFIVDDFQTDLLLTQAGLKLVERYAEKDGFVVVDVSEDEHEEFIAELREEFIWKSRRISNGRVLVALARRLLPDFESLEPLEFG